MREVTWSNLVSPLMTYLGSSIIIFGGLYSIRSTVFGLPHGVGAFGPRETSYAYLQHFATSLEMDVEYW